MTTRDITVHTDDTAADVLATAVEALADAGRVDDAAKVGALAATIRAALAPEPVGYLARVLARASHLRFRSEWILIGRPCGVGIWVSLTTSGVIALPWDQLREVSVLEPGRDEVA